MKTPVNTDTFIYSATAKKTKVFVKFLFPDLSVHIGISRLKRGVILVDAYADRGKLYIQYRYPNSEDVREEKFAAQDVLDIVMKWYPIGKKYKFGQMVSKDNAFPMHLNTKGLE